MKHYSAQMETIRSEVGGDASTSTTQTFAKPPKTDTAGADIIKQLTEDKSGGKE